MLTTVQDSAKDLCPNYLNAFSSLQIGDIIQDYIHQIVETIAHLQSTLINQTFSSTCNFFQIETHIFTQLFRPHFTPLLEASLRLNPQKLWTFESKNSHQKSGKKSLTVKKYIKMSNSTHIFQSAVSTSTIRTKTLKLLKLCELHKNLWAEELLINFFGGRISDEYIFISKINWLEIQ